MNIHWIITLLCLVIFVIYIYNKPVNKSIKKSISKTFEMKDIIILITNCKKYYYKRELQLNSWIKKLKPNVKYYHVIGDRKRFENIDSDYIFDQDSRIIYVNTDDDYLSLPEKLITAYQAVNENFVYKYIFKTDDDQEVREDFWEIILSNLEENIHYGGFKTTLKKEEKIFGKNPYTDEHPELLEREIILEKGSYCGGRFYLLSNKAINNLLINKKEIKKRVIEDHAISYYLDEKLKVNALYFNIDEYFKTKY